MDKINPKAWNRLSQNKSEIVAELPASLPKNRRWLAIYPNLGKSIDVNVPPHQYSLLDFELDRLLMTEYVGDEDLIMINKKRYYAKDESELYELLAILKINPLLFDSPWKYEYPL